MNDDDRKPTDPPTDAETLHAQDAFGHPVELVLNRWQADAVRAGRPWMGRSHDDICDVLVDEDGQLIRRYRLNRTEPTA